MNQFQHALNALRRQATREFQQSTIGRMFSEVDKLRKRGAAGRTELERMSKNLQKLRSHSFVKKELERTGVGQLVTAVDKYSRDQFRQSILDKLLGELGPLGDLVGAFLRPGGKQTAKIGQELQAASALLEAFGYRVQAPESPAQAQRQVMSEVERSKKLLESLGFTVTPPKPEESEPPPAEGEVSYVSMGGIHRTLKRDDPLLTGEMIPVSSSNVHSIGYIWNGANYTRGTLKVRFLNKRKSRTSDRGEIYHYYNVHPSLFDSFKRSASKGRWVWDHLRIRGTVSGHQYRYALDTIKSDGYVPRQAVRYGGKEYFVQRQVRGANGKTYASQLPDSFVKYWDGKTGMVGGTGPRTGAPYRAEPNRGTPNRGK